MDALRASLDRLAPRPELPSTPANGGENPDETGPLSLAWSGPQDEEMTSRFPVEDMLNSLSTLSAPPSLDPFVGSDLSGFSLSAVGAAVGGRHMTGSPESKEEALWRMVCSSDGSKPKKIPKDRVECIYRQDSGVFAPPFMADSAASPT